MKYFVSFSYEVRLGSVIDAGFANEIAETHIRVVDSETLEEFEQQVCENYRQRVRADVASITIVTLTLWKTKATR